MLKWLSREPVVALEVRCPNTRCGSVEFLDIRPAYKAQIEGGKVRLIECGRCVACLACDTPYVIVPHRPGGVLSRTSARKAATTDPEQPRANLEDRPAPRQRELDMLATTLGQSNVVTREPGL